MKTLVKVLKAIGNTTALLLGIKGEYRKEAERKRRAVVEYLL